VEYLKKITLWCAWGASALAAAELKPRTVQAFDDYTHHVQSRVEEALRTPAFLWSDQSPERNRQIRQGQVLAESLTGKEPVSVPDGLIHDWVGAVFLPGATLERTLALVQNYDHHKEIYKPEVIRSRLVYRNGNDFQIYLRLMKKKVLTVVLDTYYDVHYVPIDETRWYSRSISTRIQEVDNAGKPDERLAPTGGDHGFLWRLDTYWRFLERDGGVYLECEAVSLTRDLPRGLGWVIEPIIRDLPRESLVNTLRKTREALAAR
jgi:hypothetical protein